MKLQVLISTMFQKDYELLRTMRISTDAIVVNQTESEAIDRTFYNGNEILWVNTIERGLSNSRNCALLSSDADICLIADDDLIYNDDYEQIITKEFDNDSTLDVVAFSVRGIEGEFKKYRKNSRRVNFLSSMKISSVEIAFKRQKIMDNSILFDERFGAGAKYYMGEESIFLIECLRKGLKIKYTHKYIADLHIGESNWFEGYNERYFFDKGAVFTAMSRLLAIPYIFQFAIRKYNIYSEDLSMVETIRLMLKGRKQFLYDDENEAQKKLI